MDIHYSLSATIIVSIIISLFPMLLLFRANKSSLRAKKLLPGPMKLPIIGNLHNMIGTLPHHTLRKLSQKYGPLMHLKLGEVSTLIVSSPDMASEFMRTHDITFAQRPQLFAIQVAGYDGCDIAFAPYGEYWRQMRKVCVIELLSNKRVQSFSSVREREVRNLVETIGKSSPSPINLTERLLEMTSAITSRAAFGSEYDSKDARTLVKAIKDGIVLVGGFNVPDLYPSKKFLRVMSPMKAKLKQIFRRSDKALQNIIDKHISQILGTRDSGGDKPEGTEDLVDVLLRIQRSGDLDIPITNDNIKAVITDMFTGGTDTTATILEWAMAEMMKNPRVMQKAQSEIRQVLNGKPTIHEEDIKGLNYMKLVIKETLRLHPPITLLLPRECRERCTIDGYEIPEKTRVMINAWAIGRDPKYWGSDAESFVPERFMDSTTDFAGTNLEYIPFGAGRRICPGVSFGIATVEIALSHLLYHFDWNLPDDMKPEDLDMTELFGVSVGRKDNLYLVATPFNLCP